MVKHILDISEYVCVFECSLRDRIEVNKGVAVVVVSVWVESNSVCKTTVGRKSGEDVMGVVEVFRDDAHRQRMVRKFSDRSGLGEGTVSRTGIDWKLCPSGSCPRHRKILLACTTFPCIQGYEFGRVYYE